MLYAYREGQELLPGEEPRSETVRYRTVGDMTCTGGIRSTATTIAQIVNEIATTRITERGQTRADDQTSEAAMEDRKKAGYF
jgi:sulfate adenylyltransferase subunit 2